QRTPLTRENLTQAWLSRANLIHANLIHANLTHVNLVDTNLTGADLTGADLTDVGLIRARVDGTVFEPNSLPTLREISGAKNLELLTYNESPDALFQL